MLIDKSYFVGPLTIAQLGQKAVDDNLNNFINRWEPVIMEAALGYDFYQAFLNGINVGSDEVIEQRWLDLLNGSVFTNVLGQKKRFAGFAGGENTQTLIAAQRPNLTIYAGITDGFPQGGYSYTNTTLAGWNFDLELFGAGTLNPDTEWSYKAGGGFILTDTNYQMQYNERWIIHFTSKKVVTVQTGTQNLISPLAGFIYYEYMKNLASQNTGIGLVKSKGENSVTADSVRKPVDAFNEAVFSIRTFWELMQADQDKEIKIYPEFNVDQAGHYNYGFLTYVSLNSYGYGNELYCFKIKNVYGI